MAFIHLFRCKAEQLPQQHAFAADIQPAEVLSRSFEARPTAKVPRGATWHIGNTQRVRGDAIYFALGREAIVKAQEFDTERREFREIEQSQAPFTIGVYDPNTQVAGVLIKPGVSMNAREVASKLAILLAEPGIAGQANRHITVDFIPDPTSFIAAIEAAVRVTRFEFEFTTPNPPDDNKYIQRPLKMFASRVRATEGKASVRGEALEKGELIDLARDIAASGDDATANVQMTERSAVVRKSLRVNSLREPVHAEPHDGAGDAILQAMEVSYERVKDPDRAN